MKAAIIYWSKGGNTEKTALAIQAGLDQEGMETLVMRTDDAQKIDWYAYDLFCIGFPSYQWRPPKPVDQYLRARFAEYSKQGRVKVGAPPIPGKRVLVFCTYCGQHTGLNEATPAVQYAGQFFEHLGFAIVGEWYVVGQYHGREAANTQGRLGDIRGRPNQTDLERVHGDAARLAQTIKSA